MAVNGGINAAEAPANLIVAANAAALRAFAARDTYLPDRPIEAQAAFSEIRNTFINKNPDSCEAPEAFDNACYNVMAVRLAAGRGAAPAAPAAPAAAQTAGASAAAGGRGDAHTCALM